MTNAATFSLDVSLRLILRMGLAITFFVLVSPAAGARDRGDEAIEWAENLDAAMAQSAKDARPVIAYFTFDTCVWCKRLEEACYDDPAVVQLSRRFIWVKVNRDRTPEIPKRFNVSAYPSLLTFGDKYENVYRFQSYQEPPEFIGNLNEALRRYALYKQGEAWSAPAERASQIVDDVPVEFVPAPNNDVPSGITLLDGSLWFAQKDLYRVDARTGKVLDQFPLPASVGDLCTDGRVLYAMTYGWTAGQPIYVMDPATGEIVRRIVTEKNKQIRSHGAKGIAWHDDSLYVLSGMQGRVSQLDPASGEVRREIQLAGTWLAGLDRSGDRFLCGGRTDLFEFDAQSGAVLRQTPVNYPLRNVAYDGGRRLLVEQPIFGFGLAHERIQVWPLKTVIHRVSIR